MNPGFGWLDHGVLSNEVALRAIKGCTHMQKDAVTPGTHQEVVVDRKATGGTDDLNSSSAVSPLVNNLVVEDFVVSGA